MVNGNVPIKKSRSSLSTFISEQWEIYRKHFRRNQNRPSSNDRSEGSNKNCSSSIILESKPTITKTNDQHLSKRTFVVQSGSGSESGSSSRTRFICKTDGYYDIYRNNKLLTNNTFHHTQDAYYYERSDCPIVKSGVHGCTDERIKVQIRKDKSKSNACVAGCKCYCAAPTQSKVQCSHEGCPGNPKFKKKKKNICCPPCPWCAKHSETEDSQCSCVQKAKAKKDEKKRKKAEQRRRKKQAQKLKKAQKKCRCVAPCLLHLQQAVDTPQDGNYVPCPASASGGGGGSCNFKRCDRCYCKSTCATSPSKSSMKPQKSKDSCTCPDSKTAIRDHGGITNSNTILLPKSPSKTSYNCKETLESVRMMIKMESRQNYRNINNILNELKKQRKDIDELKKICLKTGGRSGGTAAYCLYSQYPYNGQHFQFKEDNQDEAKIKSEEHNNSIKKNKAYYNNHVHRQYNSISDNTAQRNNNSGYTLEVSEKPTSYNYTKMLVRKPTVQEKVDVVTEKSQIYQFEVVSSESVQPTEQKRGMLKFWKKKKKPTYT